MQYELFFVIKPLLYFTLGYFVQRRPQIIQRRPKDKTIWSNIMSRVCQVTGKRPMVGNKVSHANNKTKRRFEPNIQKHSFWVEEENRWVRLKLTARAMRIIDKLGIKVVLDRLRAKGEKI